MSNCDLCGSRLEPEEYGVACQRCLRPIEEWQEEVKSLMEDYKLVYEALGMICDNAKSMAPATAANYRNFEIAAAALASVKVTP
ncbi:MAG: hypothetical protein EHM35_00930 [Planctomycetaceae bacterium]|nr:MAG: hypothetical protein EHM35_00930 [Planctomycetaceae bacterium]